MRLLAREIAAPVANGVGVPRTTPGDRNEKRCRCIRDAAGIAERQVMARGPSKWATGAGTDCAQECFDPQTDQRFDARRPRRSNIDLLGDRRRIIDGWAYPGLRESKSGYGFGR